jgi:hypothetical protein
MAPKNKLSIRSKVRIKYYQIRLATAEIFGTVYPKTSKRSSTPPHNREEYICQNVMDRQSTKDCTSQRELQRDTQTDSAGFGLSNRMNSNSRHVSFPAELPRFKMPSDRERRRLSAIRAVSSDESIYDRRNTSRGGGIGRRQRSFSTRHRVDEGLCRNSQGYIEGDYIHHHHPLGEGHGLEHDLNYTTTERDQNKPYCNTDELGSYVEVVM